MVRHLSIQKKSSREKATKEVRFEKLLGGAISGKMRTMDAPVPKLPTINKILKDAQVYSVPPTPQYMQSVIDMTPQNNIAYFQYNQAFEAENEVTLHSNLMKLVSGHGSAHDHPRVARAVLESFKSNPAIAALYLKE